MKMRAPGASPATHGLPALWRSGGAVRPRGPAAGLRRLVGRKASGERAAAPAAEEAAAAGRALPPLASLLDEGAGGVERGRLSRSGSLSQRLSLRLSRTGAGEKAEARVEESPRLGSEYALLKQEDQASQRSQRERPPSQRRKTSERRRPPAAGAGSGGGGSGRGGGAGGGGQGHGGSRDQR